VAAGFSVGFAAVAVEEHAVRRAEGRMAILFTGSDAWLLSSVGLAAEGASASLKDIIAAGDAVNKAPPEPRLKRTRSAAVKQTRDGSLRITEG
jgi:hypothetical protein